VLTGVFHRVLGILEDINHVAGVGRQMQEGTLEVFTQQLEKKY
jgi:hypothetical protein